MATEDSITLKYNLVDQGSPEYLPFILWSSLALNLSHYPITRNAVIQGATASREDPLKGQESAIVVGAVIQAHRNTISCGLNLNILGFIWKVERTQNVQI